MGKLHRRIKSAEYENIIRVQICRDKSNLSSASHVVDVTSLVYDMYAIIFTHGPLLLEGFELLINWT